MPVLRPPRPGGARTDRLARRALRLLPPGARGALFRTLAPLSRLPGTESGLATLVVLCEAVDLPRLPSTLDSLDRDGHAFREVLLVPVGATAEAGVRAVLATRTDPRLRALAPRATWQDAANAGADAARGRFLQFLRACDRLPGDALQDLVRSLASSGSDLAAGGVAQRGRPALWLERAAAIAHARPARGVEPAERPELAGDLGLGNKLLRTESWRAGGHRLGLLDGWLLSPTLAAYLATAQRVDLLDRTVQEHLGGHGVRAFGAVPNQLRNLAEWAARAERVEEVLSGTPLLTGWRTHVVDVALPGFLMDTERASDEEWELLRTLVRSHLRSDQVEDTPARVDSRALLWLAEQGRRADVVTLAAAVDELAGDVPTTLTDQGEVVAAWDCLPSDVPLPVLCLEEHETPLAAAVHRMGDTAGTRRVDLFVRIAQLDVPAQPHRVSVRAPGGATVDVEAAEDPAATRWADSRFHRALLVRAEVPDRVGRIEVSVTVGDLVRSAVVELVPPLVRHRQPDPRVVVADLGLDGGDLVVSMTGSGRLRLVDDADRTVGQATVSGPAGSRIALRDRHFGRDRWLPTGHYRLVTDDGSPTVAASLAARLPCEAVGERHRLQATLGPVGGLLLHLGAPLADDEQGRWAQQRLVEDYATDESPVDPHLAYFESYVGRSATDSPRAIHDELVARRPDPTTYWGISDSAQAVPAGAVPVLRHSREWFSLLARAGCLVLNTDVEAWFRRRPGQVLLQTFHGYPSKGMGRGQWEAAGFPPSRVAELRARGVDSWSAILTPTPEMTRHYREQYDYTGPAFEHGYPRNDALVGAGAEGRRRATRELLGIRDDQTAVLYAPTWREHLAVRARRAEMADFLDLDAATGALGDSHVLLVRGHRFHRPVAAAPGVVDVTDHEEINDLILAADVAVVDYSSLRFDFALTGKPLVFLVPDLAEYGTGTRSFLFPFEESAPGPFVDDTAGVVAQVRDVVALRERYANDLAAFNATYNCWHDGHAAARVVDGLLGLGLGGADPSVR